MPVLKKIESHPDVVNYFKELPFYEELNVIKTDRAFRGYAMSYKDDIVQKKDPLIQLQASKSSFKDLFNNLLDEIKGFKYQITVKVLLRKYKRNEKIELTPVFFSSTTKTVIIHKSDLDKSLQEILYGTDNWINEGSDWITKSISS